LRTWTASSFAFRKRTLPLHGGRRWSPPTWALHACTASSPGLTKNRPLPWSAEEDGRGGALGQLLFITVEPHYLGGGSGQHQGRRTGTWPRGLHLAEPPLESQAILATETRKAEAGDGNQRQKAGRSVY
jgi:hypothetical protein